MHKIEENKKMLETAIKSQNICDWRNFHNNRAILNKKKNKKLKSDYITSKFEHNRDKWKILKEFTNQNKKGQIPQNITNNFEQITSPKQIATISNNYFIQNILKIREKFTNNNIDPLKILEFLVPRTVNNLEIPYISVPDTIALIKGIKSSNCTGYDSINNKILKKINTKIAPHLCHLINSILHSGKFPDILKLSRILPISKPNKKQI